MSKPLYLRGFWRDDTLHFDSTGHLRGTSAPISFTLSGFGLTDVYLKQDKLILQGWRTGLELADEQQKRVALNLSRGHQPKYESMYIEIAAGPTGDYGPALDAIFVDNLADIAPSLPFYWKTYARKHFLPTPNATDASALAASADPAPAQQSSVSQNAKPVHIGGSVAPPKLLHSAEPKLNNTIRLLKYSGKSLINLWVESDGKATHLSVVRALGLGFDESAVAAVQQYTFSPAMQDGKPVTVELNVEVNFQIR